MGALFVAVGVFLLFGLLYAGRGYWAWLPLTAAVLLASFVGGVQSPDAFAAMVVAVVLLALLFGVSGIRQALISSFLMRLIGKVLPNIGDTERVALEAGTVWWDGEIFSGNPDWQK